jgi:alpha-tubulin suppressor-like RCC1 family protein
MMGLLSRIKRLIGYFFSCLMLWCMAQTTVFAVTPMVVTGGSHSCALDSSGAVTCWGSNFYGQLGNNSNTSSKIPVPVPVQGLTSGVKAITAGDSHTCAIDSNGAAQCWGKNNYDQLGNNSTTDSNVPVAVSGLTSGVKAITAGISHTCAIDSSGAAQCWGSNQYGQLGDSSNNTNSKVPVAVSGLTSGVQAITTGDYHTCAIDSNGAAQCWGRNTYGQLGNNSTTDSNVPVTMGMMGMLTSGVQAITAGGDHTCAFDGGVVTCWGRNTYGQLGNSSTTDSNVPVLVLISGVKAITAGYSHTCAIDSNGAAQCWGSNSAGQLGNNSTTSSNIPVAVSGLTSGVTAITASHIYHTCAIDSSGAAQCWGSNSAGQLGNNSTTDSKVPVAVLTKSPQTITFGTTPSLSYGATATVNATGGSSGNAVTFTSTTTSICTVDSSTGVVTPVAVGTCTIAADQAGNATYSAATQVTQSITIGKTTQTIAFGTAPSLTYGGGKGTISATGGASGNAVTFTSTTTSICTVSGTNGVTVTPVAAGTCTIAADQAGNANYSAAAQLTQNITVAKAAQAAFSASVNNANLIPGCPAVTLSYTGGSGSGAVTYASNNANCTISGNTFTTTTVGSCVITATKAADANYLDATATVNITVDPLPPPVTPSVPSYGQVSTSTGGAGAELVVAGGTLVTGGKNGGSIQATGKAGISTVSITSGSVEIPCPVATSFCKPAEVNLNVLAGESVTLSPDGKVTSIQINPATPSTPITRLNGKSLIDAVVEALRADNPALGSETSRKADDWNALGINFNNSGNLSVSAQLPLEVNPNLPDGVKHLPNGVVQVTTQGVVVHLVPRLTDTARFNAALMNVSSSAEMQVKPDGSFTVNINRVIYSMHPNLFTTNTDTSEFTFDTNGNLRFGNQGITPAAYNFDQFTSMLKEIAPTATAQVQADGKLVVALQGMTYTLIPDYHVSPSTTSASSSLEIRNGKLFVNYPFGFSQGFTVQ